MALVVVGTETVDFDKRERVDFGPVTLRADESHLFTLNHTPRTDSVEGGYIVVNSRFANSGNNLRSPLIIKYFPTGTGTAFFVNAPRVRDTNNQRVLIQLNPKEFYRGASPTRQIDVTLSRETGRTWPLGMRF